MTTRHRFFGIIVLVALLTSAMSTQASTWRVSLDGSGDTDSIHEAGLMAASGDTISIAVGRYDALVSYTGGWFISAFFEEDKNLTIIGDDRDNVIIGPQNYYDNNELQAGFFWNTDNRLTIENLMLVNAYHGVVARMGRVIVRNCRISGNSDGIHASGSVRTVTLDSAIVEIGRLPGKAPPNAGLFCQDVDSCFVDNSEFFYHVKADLESVTYSRIRNTEFDGSGLESIQGQFIAEKCTVNRRFYFELGVSGGVVLRDNIFYNYPDGWSNLEANSSSTHIEMTGNEFYGGSEASIILGYGASMEGTGNHIFRTDSTNAIQLRMYPEGSTASIDLRGNYWGTTEADSVAAWIWDGNDDPSIHAVVEYLPIEPNPVPEEKTSLGGLKALFR